MAVKKLVRNSCGIKAFVHPVPCFSRAKPSCYKPVRKVEVTNLGSLNRSIVNRRDHYSVKEVKAIAHLLEKKLGISPAAGPDLSPDKSSRVAAFLARDRNLVFGILLLFLALTVFFPNTAATFFESTAAIYRVIGAMVR